MRKVKIADYLVKFRVPDRLNPGKMIEGEHPYYMKESIHNLLFNPDLKLTSAHLVRQNMLAMKIEQCEDEDLLEDEEYTRLKKAIDTFQGFNRNDVELVRRINEAEVVEVEQKEVKGG